VQRGLKTRRIHNVAPADGESVRVCALEFFSGQAARALVVIHVSSGCAFSPKVPSEKDLSFVGGTGMGSMNSTRDTLRMHGSLSKPITCGACASERECVFWEWG